MTGLINQLVEEIKDVAIEPKYVVTRMDIRNDHELKKLFCGNDKKKLKERLLEHLIKEMMLEDYLDVDKLKNCKKLYLIKNRLCLALYRRNDEGEIIEISSDTDKYKYYIMDLNKENILKLYTYSGSVFRYSIIDTLEV